jgi:hypothetical protein
MLVNLWEVRSSFEYAYMHGQSCELAFGDSSKKRWKVQGPLL